LNAILGMAYLLGQTSLSSEQHDKLAKVTSAGKHLMLVVNDILDLAKIESGTVELHVAPFDPAAVVQEIGVLIGETARKKGLAIHIDTATLPPRVIGDATRLRQALLNLAGNAVKFSEQGSVTLRGEISAENVAQFELRFTVVDTGPGISAVDQPRLFTAFEQVDNSASRVHGGTGLGLAITRRLARLMGGEVGVDSTPGQGSSFWLRIRVDRSKAVGVAVNVAATLALAPSGSHQLTAHILLAEDDPMNQDVAVGLLGMLGCRVDVAVNGEEAVKMAADRRYDLILMDIQMPVLNGIDAAEQIRQFEQYKKIPILAMTANVLADDKARCLRHGMNDFIAKPVIPEQLFATLLRWLPHLVVTPVPDIRAPATCLPLTAAEMAAALTQLTAALANGDHEASGIFLRIEGHLAAIYGDALLPVKNAIDRFDFEKASLLLAELVSDQ
jgi:CheY-like chemotaxis protein/anti-sigma regulatory factor (Ser/Thr protein kinase)